MVLFRDSSRAYPASHEIVFIPTFTSGEIPTKLNFSLILHTLSPPHFFGISIYFFLRYSKNNYRNLILVFFIITKFIQSSPFIHIFWKLNINTYIIISLCILGNTNITYNTNQKSSFFQRNL